MAAIPMKHKCETFVMRDNALPVNHATQRYMLQQQHCECVNTEFQYTWKAICNRCVSPWCCTVILAQPGTFHRSRDEGGYAGDEHGQMFGFVDDENGALMSYSPVLEANNLYVFQCCGNPKSYMEGPYEWVKYSRAALDSDPLPEPETETVVDPADV